MRTRLYQSPAAHFLRVMPFRTFGLASIYGFLSALFVGVSINVFTSVRISPPSSTVQEMVFYVASGLFLFASLGLFVITWQLQDAEREWLAGGAPRDALLVFDHIDKRIGILWGSLLVTVLAAGTGCAALLYRPPLPPVPCF